MSYLGSTLKYQIGREAKLYAVDTNPAAVGPDLHGALGYSEMTPLFVLKNPSGSGRRAYLTSVVLCETVSPGALWFARAVIDRADRYVTLSGISRTPGISTTGFAPTDKASVVEFYDEEPDLEASEGTEQFVGFRSFGISPGQAGGMDLESGVIVEPGHLFAVYAWTGTAPDPQVRYFCEWVEDKGQG